MSKFVEGLSELANESISSVITDPTEHTAETWAECFRVLKPGAYLLAFSDTRKHHRLTVAIEDAGFEIRDALHWVLSKEGIQHRVIVMARKPLAGTVIENLVTHGTGALNIDESRVGTEQRVGRWPTNTLLTHHTDCVLTGTSKETFGRDYAKQGSNSFSVGQQVGVRTGTFENTQSVALYECMEGCPVPVLDGQVEGASRYFKHTEWGPLDDDKPVELVTYLLRMVTPSGGKILDPFLGGGDTAVAASLSGYEWVGVTETPDVVTSRIANTIH